MNPFIYDVRLAIRSLRRQPASTILIALMLALGICVNAAMFGVADRLLFRPPAFLHHPDATGRVYFSELFRGARSARSSASYPLYAAVRDGTARLATVAAHTTNEVAVAIGDDIARLPVTGASASFWSLFDAHPFLGRFFSAADDQLPSGENVAVLGYGAWRTRFGADRSVVGRQVRIGATQYTVIGVAPPQFTGMELTGSFAYIPITSYGSNLLIADFATRGQTTWLEIAARQRDGVAAPAVNSDLTRAFLAERGARYTAAQLERARPEAELGSIIQGRGPEGGTAPAVAAWLLGLSIAVVLIACANAANLLLARAAARQREYAVRVALGASRWRLMTGVLTEALVLAACAGAAGLVASAWAGRAVERLLLPDGAASDAAMLDSRTVLWAAIVAVGCGLLAGVVPLGQVLRSQQATMLRSGDRSATASRSKLRTALVVVQVAMSVVLLSGAGLFLQSFRAAQHVDLGYEPGRVVLVDPDLSSAGLTTAEQEQSAKRLMERARQIPGVSHVARATTVPFMRNSYDPFWVPGIDSLPHRGEYAINVVSRDYFVTMGTRILRGRDFTDADRSASPREIIVSESMARQIWPGKEALGQCVRLLADTMPCSNVVGVVQDIRRGDFGSDVRLQYYVPWSQYPHGAGVIHLRVADARAISMPVIARTLQATVPSPAVVRVLPMEERLALQLQAWRLGATMFTIFAGLAVLLVAAGLLGVLGFDVTQRTREFGIRMALGSTPAGILRLVVRHGLGLTLAGLLLGLAITFAGATRLGPLLFRTSPHDTTTTIAVTALLACVGLCAGLIPALRAMRTSIVAALS